MAATVFLSTDTLEGIANAIRTKKNVSTQYKPSEMAAAIESINTGSAVLIQKNISANGTYNPSDDEADGYSEVIVDVANSYVAADEGKVVNNGALVSQGSQTVTNNGTYDTTLINSLTVSTGSGNPYSFVEMVEHAFDEAPLTYNGNFVFPYGFAGSNITELYGPNLWRFSNVNATTAGTGSHVCYNCKKLTKVDLPHLVANGSGGYQFAGCTALTDVYLPFLPVGQYGFNGCTSLEKIAIPALLGPVSMNGYSLKGCTNLKEVDLGLINKVNTEEMNGCSKLNKLIIRAAAVPTLQNLNAFNNTPFASGKAGGTLYVPSSLISSYQSANNWSTILGYANNSIQAIEGTVYEHTYADGRPVFHTVTQTLTGCTLEANTVPLIDVYPGQSGWWATYGNAFEATVVADDGKTISSVSVTMGGVDVTSGAYNQSTHKISIGAVSGDIAITVTAS